MNRKLLIAVMTLISIPVFAQSAKVIQLDTADAAEAKQVYQQMQDAQKAWNDIQKRIASKYVEERFVAQTGTKLTKNKKGWENGFNFSEDFKSIVPMITVTSGIGSGQYISCCVYNSGQ